MNVSRLSIDGSLTSETLFAVRRRIIQIAALYSLIRTLFPGVFFALSEDYFQQDVFSLLNNFILFSVILVLVYLLWFWLALTNRLTIAANGLVITLLVSQFVTPPEVLGAVSVMILIAAIIRNTVPFSILTTITFGLAGYQAYQAVVQNTTVFQLGASLSIIGTIALAGIVVRYFISAIETTVLRAERNSNLLRVGVEVGQITAGLIQMDELLPRAVDFIRDRFGFYHVQIFLIDDSGERAVLRASTGEVGKRLLERRHQLNIGSNSVIGRVTKTGEPVIARDTDRAGVHYRNELLPNTRAELALPIKDGERLIGALDVQSTRPNTFEPTDVQALQIMTNLLAASIRNARLFEQQKRNIQENQRLYIEAEANLREIQRLNRQLTRESWQRLAAEAGTNAGITLTGNHAERESNWSELQQRAMQARQPIVETQSDGTLVIAAPILLRNEVIGAVEITPDASLSQPDTLEILRAVSERLGVSLDNARLFEEAQLTTAFEQRINDIVGQYQDANSVDELLRITVAELGQVLGADHAAIRLASQTENDDILIEGATQ
ncbi:MAG: GAF domain-containing protein [Phototrophicaceae bacterium]|jgi:GAF domain-containing protein